MIETVLPVSSPLTPIESLILSKLENYFFEILLLCHNGQYKKNNACAALTSVLDPDPDQTLDPDPPDLHVFGPPGSGSFRQRYGIRILFWILIRILLSSFYHQAKIIRKTLIPTVL
jgi:hypothetical protein